MEEASAGDEALLPGPCSGRRPPPHMLNHDNLLLKGLILKHHRSSFFIPLSSSINHIVSAGSRPIGPT